MAAEFAAIGKIKRRETGTGQNIVLFCLLLYNTA
jgi:hypothetical protein